jgi:sulfoxide reductase heme-binding subunit YedZ
MRTAAETVHLVADPVTATESVHMVAAAVGFTSLFALWVGMMWGTTLRSGWLMSRMRHSTIYGLHMNIVLFGLWLGVVHAFAQLAVPQGKVRWIDEGVPFVNQFDPIGVGLGTTALELMLAFALSVLLQRKLGYHRWRTLHSLAYLAFTGVAAHVLISGSDMAGRNLRMLVAAGWLVAMVAGLVTFPAIARLPRRLVGRFYGQVQAAEVTVNVDPTRCARFGFCEHEAPTIFSLRSDGRLAYRSSVPADQAEAVMQAALVCPARAIALGKLPSSVVVPAPADPPPPRGRPPQSRRPEPARPAAPPRAAAPEREPAPTATTTGPIPITNGMTAANGATGPTIVPPPPATEPTPTQRWAHPPAPNALDDTGRHHLRPIRPVGGRSGGGR